MRVPQYQPDSISPTGMPDVRFNQQAPLDAFGGGAATADAFGMARGMAQDSTGYLVDKMKEAQKQADDDAMTQARVALNDFERQQKTDVQSKRGVDALNTTSTLDKALQKFTSDYETKLATPEQKSAYRAMAAARRDYLLDWGSGYEKNARDEVHVGGLKASTASSMERAAADPSTVGLESKIVDDNTRKLAQFNGLTPDETEQARRQAQSTLNFGILKRMVDSRDDLSAKLFYDKYKASFIGEQADDAAKWTSDSTYRGEAQKLTQKIVSPGVTDLDGGIRIYNEKPPTEAESFERVDKIEDPKLQDMVRDRVRQYWADKRRADELDYQKALLDAGGIAERTGSVDSIPQSTQSLLKLGDMSKLKMIAQKAKNGFPPESSAEKWKEIEDQARNDPTAFVKRNLLFDKYDLSESDWKAFGKLQSEVKEKGPKTASMLSFQQRLQDTLLANNIFSDTYEKLSGDEKKQYAQFALSADARIRQFEQAELKGQAATPAQQQQVIDKMLQEKVDEKGMLWWKRPVLGGQVLLEDIKVPDTKRAEFNAYAKSIGKTMNDDKAARMYRAFIAGDRGLFDRIAGE